MTQSNLGCGGTGVELLKLLGDGCNTLLLIDHDRISLSNLHRLSLFTQDDEGAYKSQRAAEILNSKHPGTAEYLVERIENVSPGVLDEYEAVIGAFDNVEARMNLNLMFCQSRCWVLIDCGISGYKAHAKAVWRGAACLYCIRELYVEESSANLCSLRPAERVDADNRGAVLRSLVELERERDTDRVSGIERVLNEFNALVEADSLRAAASEVAGMYDNVMPNVCFINAICASMACILLHSDRTFDFMFYSGDDAPTFSRLLLCRDEGCIVCAALLP